jgi:hypothetical protein
MKDVNRKEAARVLAEAYAPAPTDSRLIYGLVAASLVMLGAAAAGAFYSVDLLPHLGAILGLSLVAFAAGLIFRRMQMSRHRKAHRSEYHGIGEAVDTRAD